uniref:Teleost multiple tissue opsin 2a n=1 Tax=Cyclopterus lumpus TaxID=8103 RepID=A0A8C3G183_CYCLU
MLVCVCGTTLSFASSLRCRWLYGRHGCMWYGFVNSCFGIVSLVSLAGLSYERYSTLMVCNKRVSDYRKPLLAVGGSWLYSVVWTVPPLLGWSSYGLEGAGTSCSVTWTERSSGSHSYIICLFVFCLGVPVVVMVYCYSRLLLAVRQVGHIRRTAARRREFHILFMVVTTVVCYLLCWMPYGVIAMMATFGRPGAVSPITAVVPSILAKSSTVINPVIYILMNKQVSSTCGQVGGHQHESDPRVLNPLSMLNQDQDPHRTLLNPLSMLNQGQDPHRTLQNPLSMLNQGQDPHRTLQNPLSMLNQGQDPHRTLLNPPVC